MARLFYLVLALAPCAAAALDGLPALAFPSRQQNGYVLNAYNASPTGARVTVDVFLGPVTHAVFACLPSGVWAPRHALCDRPPRSCSHRTAGEQSVWNVHTFFR